MRRTFVTPFPTARTRFEFHRAGFAHPVKVRTDPKWTVLRLLSMLSALLVVGQPEAATLIHRFEADPGAAGWEAFGHTNLFTWNPAGENLEVTWDSAQSNSYYALPLGRTLTRTNDFLLAFDLHLDDINVGTTAGKPYTFEIALGLMHHTQTTNASLARGSGLAPNIVEFDYFPNDVNDYGATVSTALISTSTNYWGGGFTSPFELVTNTVYRVQMVFRAADQTLHCSLTSNGVPAGPLADATIGGAFGDFLVDTVAVCSYSDQGQFPGYEGSILAHGSVDNIVFASPLPVTHLSLPSAPNEVAFLSDSNWVYTLEASTNLHTWSATGPAVPGNGKILSLADTNPPANLGVYRVRANIP